LLENWRIKTKNQAKLVTTFLDEGLDIIGPIKPTRRLTRNKYILDPIDYPTKWVEAKAFKTNIVIASLDVL
jgi:hypothetical protein